MERPSLYHDFDNPGADPRAGVQRLTDKRNVTAELRDVEGDAVERLTALMLGLGRVLSENRVWIRILLRSGWRSPTTSAPATVSRALPSSSCL